eukprot:10052883-Heterocapsa_arctica.AAC.1
MASSSTSSCRTSPSSAGVRSTSSVPDMERDNRGMLTTEEVSPSGSQGNKAAWKRTSHTL